MSERFPFLTGARMFDYPPPAWLVRDVLPASGRALLYGESGIGKSFTALGLGLHVAAGLETWGGAAMERSGPVVYLAYEGAFGLIPRLRAGLEYHDLPESALDDFHLLPCPQLALSDGEAVAALAADLPREVALVVVDTFLDAAGPINENSSGDVAQVTRGQRALVDATGATVLLISHETKGGDLRGSTALGASQDCILHLASHGGGTRLELVKQRDGPKGWAQTVTLEPSGGSCVAVLTPPRTPPRDGQHASRTEEAVLGVLRREPNRIWSRRDVSREGSVPQGTVDRHLSALVASEKVLRLSRGSYRLNLRSPESSTPPTAGETPVLSSLSPLKGCESMRRERTGGSPPRGCGVGMGQR